MEVIVAVVLALAAAYVWMRWDEHRELRKQRIANPTRGETRDAERS
ncbi:MAG: hypothetical protein ACFCUO_08600 [Rhodospirillales bacterium]